MPRLSDDEENAANKANREDDELPEPNPFGGATVESTRKAFDELVDAFGSSRLDDRPAWAHHPILMPLGEQPPIMQPEPFVVGPPRFVRRRWIGRPLEWVAEICNNLSMRKTRP